MAKIAIIKVDIDTGQVVVIGSENATVQEGLSVKEEIQQKKPPLIGELLWAHSSPGCVYWNGSRWVKFC